MRLHNKVFVSIVCLFPYPYSREAIGPVFASWITDVQSFGWTMTYLSAICLFMVSEIDLNQRWLIIIAVLWHSPERTKCTNYSIMRNEFEILLLKLLPHLPHGPTTQITRFMGPTWGPSGSCRPQVGPMLAPWTLRSEELTCIPFPFQALALCVLWISDHRNIFSCCPCNNKTTYISGTERSDSAVVW